LKPITDLKESSMMSYQGVKVFSATKFRDREALGETLTEWLESNHVEVVDTVITQSSDSAFHCLTITLFYRNALPDQN
jgi:hypothetical protein